MKFNLPDDHRPYTDKYFLRSNKILRADNFNPRVVMQVFVRIGPGKIVGINEAVAILDKYSPLREHGGKIHALPEGSRYGARETVMFIEGPLQDFIELETMYLGVISAETTLANGGPDPDLSEVGGRMKGIVWAAAGRPVLYFGARHWRWDWDSIISHECFRAGARECSTDIGASTIGRTGVGTIPHALILAYGGTVEAAMAFTRHIDPSVGLTVLIDTFNREITDSLLCAKIFKDRLWAVRIDTCGENRPQWAPTTSGRGVTFEGVAALREALDKDGFQRVKIIVSSGFNAEKTRKFVEAEEKLGKRIFDAVGTGSVFGEGVRFATADIVMVDGTVCSKVGRSCNLNPRLVEM